MRGERARKSLRRGDSAKEEAGRIGLSEKKQKRRKNEC